MRQYIISLDIDPIDQNAVYGILPLHCTIMPRFETIMSPAKIAECTEKAFKGIGYIPIRSGELERFGQHKEVAGHRIQPEDEVRHLHKEVLGILRERSAEFPESSQWLGDNFTPHVSNVIGREFSRGRLHVFRTATIFERCIVDSTRILRPRACMQL